MRERETDRQRRVRERERKREMCRKIVADNEGYTKRWANRKRKE